MELKLISENVKKLEDERTSLISKVNSDQSVSC